jgi:hypothetical protein
LGVAHPDLLLSQLDSKQISEWMAFYQVEPFGEERADLRSAIIACVTANAWRGKNQKPFEVSDFLPKFDPPKQQTLEEMKTILRATLHGKGR